MYTLFMEPYFEDLLKRSRVLVTLLTIVFTFYALSWIYLNLFVPHDSALNDYFTDTYGVVACVGGFLGFTVARLWGALKSIVGRSLSFLSLGLLFQFLGQLSYAIYYYVYNVENPYPSFGEVFYFGSIPIYICGVWLLARALGVGRSLRTSRSKYALFLIPLIMLFISYQLFLKDYEVDSTSPVTTFLDYGYPFGQAIFISLTIVAFIFSKKALGGILRKSVMFVFMALVFQYFADTIFLYETLTDTWRPGGLDDLLFVTSYFSMAFALSTFASSYKKLTVSRVKVAQVEAISTTV